MRGVKKHALEGSLLLLQVVDFSCGANAWIPEVKKTALEVRQSFARGAVGLHVWGAPTLLQLTTMQRGYWTSFWFVNVLLCLAAAHGGQGLWEGI